MNRVVRAIAVIYAGASMAGVAAAASTDGKATATVAPAASKADADAVRSDRLDPAVVERETQRRSTSKPKPPVMPAERS
jgi:hypothetical protein